MHDLIRDLEATNKDGVKAELFAIYAVPRSETEIAADAPPHFMAEVVIAGRPYFDVVDLAAGFRPLKGDPVAVTFTRNAEGTGMPILAAA